MGPRLSRHLSLDLAGFKSRDRPKKLKPGKQSTSTSTTTKYKTVF